MERQYNYIQNRFYESILRKYLNNLNDIFFQMVTKLQEDDVMMLGGDYVQFCSDCCIRGSKSIVE